MRWPELNAMYIHPSFNTCGFQSQILTRIHQGMIRGCRTLSMATPASEQMLQVSEIFRSIQGEGPFTGRPSIFLRLGVCNLSCVWCDTPYTWLFTEERLQKIRSRVEASDIPDTPIPKKHEKVVELRRWSVFDVVEEVVNQAGPSVRNVVITGGEPLLHKKPLLEVVPMFFEHGFTIEFETNGTISPSGLPSRVHLNVSPKLSNSMQPQHLRINAPVLEQCLAFPSSIIKFVVNDQADVAELLDVISLLNIDARRVYLMPQGSDSGEIEEKGRWLVDTCLRYGFNYSHRLQVELWGAKRGI